MIIWLFLNAFIATIIFLRRGNMYFPYPFMLKIRFIIFRIRASFHSISNIPQSVSLIDLFDLLNFRQNMLLDD